jgi:hypothetical protein
MDIDKAIEGANRIHDAIFALVREWPDIYLKDQAWLRSSIGEHDFWMDTPGPNGDIVCYGNCYSMQTMDHEWFTFVIPRQDLTEWLDAHDPD